jgi:hypothetical protein
MKFTLKKPITVAEKTVTEIELRDESVCGDWSGIAMRDPMLFDDMMKFASNLTDGEIPLAAIKKLSNADWQKVQVHVGKLLKDGPETETK